MTTPERAASTPTQKPTQQQQPSEKKQIGTPVSRIEDSPVFNYINNLSPIKPVKSLHITQSFQSLSFPPVPSIFSSPHVHLQKVSKFVLRPHTSHPPKPGDGSTSQQGTGVFDVPRLLVNDVAPSNVRNHQTDEGTDLPADEQSQQNNMILVSLQHKCGSPNRNIVPYDDVNSDNKLDASSALLIDDVSNGLEESENLPKYDVERGSMQRLKQANDVPECEWKAMISEDTEDLMAFESLAERESYYGNSEVLEKDSDVAPVVLRISEETMHAPEKTQTEEPSELFLPLALQDSLKNLDEEDERQDVRRLTGTLFSAEDKQATQGMELMYSVTGNYDPPANKVEFKQQRGMLRRCLVFEMAGASPRNACTDSSENSSTSFSCQGEISDVEKQKCSEKCGSFPSPCLLPSIGLHLNSLSSAAKDEMPKRDCFPREEGQITTRPSVLPFHSLLQSETLQQVSSSADDGQCGSGEDQDLQVRCESSMELEIGICEELNSSSVKKKIRNHGSNTESGACKRCNCKKSKCLKLYCECFAAGVYCVEPCTCRDCFNKPMHEDTVLATRKQIESRNPLAFAPKVIRESDAALVAGDEANKTPASARHKRGCNCKKSNCLKKYCECYQEGVACTVSCRCEGCKNKFGTKFGKLPAWNEEIEHGDEEKGSSRKVRGKLDNRQSITCRNDGQQSPETIAPITPSFPIVKSSGKPPCPSTGKPPRSTVLVIGSSPRLNAFKAVRRSEVTPCQFNSSIGHSHAVPMDETPDILRGDPPSTGIKVSSPNRKRVSPPHDKVFSPRPKGSRKLILKSIPSFPSLSCLASEANNDDGPSDPTRELLCSSPVDMDGAMPTTS